MAPQTSATHSAIPPSKSEIAFIDRGVDDLATLLAELRPEVEPILLSDDEPAPRQMARALQGREQLGAIHIIAHGRPGEVSFAAGPLSLETMDKHASDVCRIGAAISKGGQLLLWSCETGQGHDGAAFVEELTLASRAQVAAATRLVGAATRGGRWELALGLGSLQVRAPLSATGVATYAGVMSNITWNGSTSTDWKLAGNWTGGLPGTNDDVVIGTTTNSPNLTSSSGNTHIKSLTLNGSDTLTLQLSGTAVLQVSNGTTLSSTGGITGFGTLNSAVTVSNTANTSISATGGMLEVTGAITNAGTLQLTIGSGATDKLLLDGASAATSATFLGTTGMLEIASSGSLTLSSALAIGSNTLKLDAAGTAQLTDAAGVMLAGGAISGTGSLAGGTTLTGYGTVSAPLVAGTGAITASAGTLDLTGSVASRPLAIASASASDLKIDGTATSSAPISISSVTQTLEIGSAGNLTITGAESITNGKIQLDGGTLTDSAGVTIGSGATLTGSGTAGAITLSGGTITQTGSALTLDSITGHGIVTGSPTITTVTASGGTLDFQGTIDATTLTSFHVANGGDLKFDGDVGSGPNTPSITFDGVSSGTGVLDLTGEGRGPSGEIAKFDGTVSNFATGDQILVSGLSGDTVSYSGGPSGGTLTVKNSGGTTEETINLTGDYTHATFSIAAGSTDTITTSADCFLEGTRVRTPDGEVAVETLNRGDIVLTSDGATKPVTWLGKQTISTVFSDPLRVWPIRIKAGALRENVPVRDLFLSPDHAVLVDGALIQAGALVNGTSIVRETTVPRIFVYYHVELDDHSLILAENTPAETFVDNVDRLRFDNWAEHEALYPDGKSISELPYPRAKAHRQVPVNIRVMLAERARLIGAVPDRSAVA